MKFLRKLLFPFALIYCGVMHIRNFLYNNAFFKSSVPSIPVIAVGNLSVGGTGKTPMIEYLIRLLESQYAVAVLSRGYKRKSIGFVMANNSTFERVRTIIIDQLGVETDAVTMEANFRDDLDADSLDLVELIMAFEEEFGGEITDDDAKTIITVGDAVNYLSSASDN